MSNQQLQPNDCHYTQRQAVLKHLEPTELNYCVSLAWDWSFRGTTQYGIDKLLSSTLSAALFNREHNLPSLGIPERSTFCLGRKLKSKSNPMSMKEKKKISAGILPTLKSIREFYDHAIVEVLENGVTNHGFRAIGGEAAANIIRYVCLDLCSYRSLSIQEQGDPDPKCSICSYELSNHYIVKKTPKKNVTLICLRCIVSGECRVTNQKKAPTLFLCYTIMSQEREQKILNTISEIVSADEKA